MDSPKVSVIVPVYNGEKYLCECLDSLVNQTLREIEIICVNDGSTDSSGLILGEYATRDKRCWSRVERAIQSRRERAKFSRKKRAKHACF